MAARQASLAEIHAPFVYVSFKYHQEYVLTLYVVCVYLVRHASASLLLLANSCVSSNIPSTRCVLFFEELTSSYVYAGHWTDPAIPSTREGGPLAS